MTALALAVDGLFALDPGAIPTVETGDALVALGCQRRRLDAVDAALSARYASGGQWGVDGYRSPAAGLAAATTDSLGSLRGRLRVGEQAAAYPVMAAALAEGTVSVGHLQALADVHRRHPRLAAELAGMEADLVAAARTAPPEVFARGLLALLHTLDPDAADEAEARRRDTDAGLHLSSLADGWGRLDAILPPEVHAHLRALLDAALTAERRNTITHDRGNRGAVHGDAAGHDGDGGHGDAATSGPRADTPAPDPEPAPCPAPRVPAKLRNLAAFQRILDAATAATGEQRLPDTGGGRPVVTITIPIDTVTGERDMHASRDTADNASDTVSAAAGGIDLAAAESGFGWWHRTRGLIGTRTAQLLTCDATVRRLLVTPTGVPLELGRSTRVIPPGLRTTIEARDRWQCRFPGCRNRIDHIHHIIHWILSGTTNPANLAGLCFGHHEVVHRVGWTITGDANHTLWFHQPDDPIGRASPSPGTPR